MNNMSASPKAVVSGTSGPDFDRTQPGLNLRTGLVLNTMNIVGRDQARVIAVARQRGLQSVRSAHQVCTSSPSSHYSTGRMPPAALTFNGHRTIGPPDDRRNPSSWPAGCTPPSLKACLQAQDPGGEPETCELLADFFPINRIHDDDRCRGDIRERLGPHNRQPRAGHEAPLLVGIDVDDRSDDPVDVRGVEESRGLGAGAPKHDGPAHCGGLQNITPKI